MSDKKKIVIGIDLGTTNTCVAQGKILGGNGKVTYEALDNRVGARTTPSMVSFQDGDVVIGQVAKNSIVKNPKNTIYGAKRLIGKKANDPEVIKLFKNAQFKIIGDDDNNPVIEVEVNGKTETYYPEQISGIVLGEVLEIVKNKTGKLPDHCIITVPAYFNELQRAATKHAAEIAKLPVMHLVNEPTAAAVAFQYFCKFDKGTVLVYDFGGGTLDVSIVEVNNNKFEVKAVAGNTALGGEDIDATIVQEMVERFMKKHPGKDPRTNPRSMALLKLKAEEAKIQLSSTVEARIVITNFLGSDDLDETLSRAKLEFICDDDIFSKLTECVDKAIEDAGIDQEDITHIILVGGSSYIPIVRQTIAEYFENRITPLNAVAPDTAIAVGAAILCDKMVKGLAFNDITKLNPPVKHTPATETEEDDEGDGFIEIVDVQSSSIGIRSGKSGFKKFIHRNKPLPQEDKFVFRTTRANQTHADVDIFIGEDDVIDPDERTHIEIGKFTLSDLPRKPKGQVLITVKMRVDETGIINVSAQCQEDESSIHKECRIDTKEVFNDSKIKEAIKIQQEIFDTKTKRNEYLELLNDFQSAIAKYKTKHGAAEAKVWEQNYKNLSDNIPSNKVGIEKAIDNLRKTIESITKKT